MNLYLTQQELAKKWGFTDGNYIYMLESGKKPFPKKIERKLLELENEVRKSLPSPILGAISDGNIRGIADPRVVRQVPVVSWAKAGAASNYDDLCGQIDQQVETDCKDPNSFGLIIEGDSMSPRFEAGDIVVFAPNSEPRNGDFVVARLKETGGVMFKRFRRVGREGTTIRLESLNPDYNSQEFPMAAFRFIYPAVGMTANFR